MNQEQEEPILKKFRMLIRIRQQHRVLLVETILL